MRNLQKCALGYAKKLLYQKQIPKISFNSVQKYSTHENAKQTAVNVPDYLEFKNNWPQIELQKCIEDMKVVPNFITEEEESSFLTELEPYLKRMRYEFDHWDNAIHGFRETERKKWYPQNKSIVHRIQQAAFKEEVIPYIHVLDLAEDGVIKPHVDSTRYCGSTIAGISLLSDSVMRLVRLDDEKLYLQNGDHVEEYRAQPEVTANLNKTFYVNILLKRRSLYIMKDTARYNFTHQLLAKDVSIFKNNPIEKLRRISIICRNEP